MNDRSEFVLRLIDRITAPSKSMLRAVRALRQSLRDLKTAETGATAGAMAAGKAVRKAGVDAAMGAKGFDAAARAMDRAAAGRSRTLARQARIRELGLPGPQFGPVFDRRRAGLRSPFLRITNTLGGGGKAAQGLWDWNKAAGAAIERWGALRASFMSTPFGYVLSGIGRIATGLFDVVKYAGMAVLKVSALAVALGGVAAAALTKFTVGLAMFAERSRNAFSNVIGDRGLGEKAFEHGRKLAKEFGLDVEETIGSMVKLRSMQFSIKESTELIKISADLQTISKDAEATKRAITAITQIKAKGKLQSEELVGQLAEAGVSTVLVYEQLEKILKTNRQGVLKQLQQGAIDADTGITAIKAAILHKLQIDEAGKAGRDFANNTLAGLMNQVKSAPAQFGLDLEKLIDTGPVRGALQQIIGAFDGIDRNAVAGFIQQMIVGLSGIVPVVIEFGRGFGDSLGKITEALSFGKTGLMEYARGAGQSLGEFFAGAITLSKKLITVVPKALGGFFSGLDAGGIMRALEQADWKRIGSDIAVVARAIGSLVGGVAKLARVLGVGGGIAPQIERTGVDKVRKKDFGGVGGFILNDLLGVDTFERKAPAQSRLGGGGGQSEGDVNVGQFSIHVDASNSGSPKDVAHAIREGAFEALDRMRSRNIGLAQ